MLNPGSMGISDRKQREKEIKRKAILDAALTLFKEKGFLNVTIQDIANFAEISPGSIYLQYKSKDDIYAAIADLGTVRADDLFQKYFVVGKKLTIGETGEIVRKFIAIYEEFGVYFDVLLLSYKGKKSFPELSSQTLFRLKEGAITTLMRSIHYFLSVGGESDVETLKSKILLCWAMLLGVAQVVDVGGRKELLGAGDVEAVLDKCASQIHEILLPAVGDGEKISECHS